MCSERLLIVGTYRSDELHRRHPLRPLLAELGSDPYTRLIELPRFTREELGEQLEGILADPPRAELVERVYARSEGNALYAEEILAAGLDGRGALPPTLRDALMLRVERLSKNAQDVLQWLACQPAADHALVAAVAGLEPGELRDALREAVASHIVVTVGDDATASATRCCARSCTTTCCRASAPRCTRRWRVRSRTGSRAVTPAPTSPPRRRTTGRGGRPAAGARGRGARGARRGARERLRRGAGAVRARAGSVGARAGPEAVADMSQIDLLRRAAFAADQAGDPAARRRSSGARSSSWARTRPARVRAAPRAAEPVALVAAPPGRGDRGAEARPGAVPRGRPERGARHAAVAAREEAHVAGPADRGEGRRRGGARDRARRPATARPRGARSTRWAPPSGCRARWRAGVRLLRESLDIASELGHAMDIGGPGQHRGCPEPRRSHARGAGGRAGGPRGGVQHSMADRRLATALDRRIPLLPRRLGRGGGSDPGENRRHSGGTLLLWQVGRAALALGRGDLALAEEALSSMDRVVAGMTEPQFVGPYG